MTSKPAELEIRAARYTFTGAVQGVGFRPAIARFARRWRLCGTVANAMQGVVVEIEGDASALAQFARHWRDALPDQVRVTSVRSEAIEPVGCETFTIVDSQSVGRPVATVPLDLKICELCLAEMRDRSNRRYGYPFTNCTNCGPRYSILDGMPYDRARTSMSRFEMCTRCAAEYASAEDRRFHAQTNCCRDCGPRLWYWRRGSTPDYENPLLQGAATIQRGEILALKGLGGYQLICDATNEAAVQRLRLRKRRPSKPLAVMVRTIDEVERLARMNSLERQAIAGPAGPILLLHVQSHSPLAKSIHPGLNTVGVMLPTTGVHALLADVCGAPLVVTSGNVEGEPLAYRREECESDLSPIADAFVHHDREIVRPVDDSVVRCMGERIVTIRAARGLAPMAIDLRSDAAMLAVGGQQKACLALSNGSQTILGPHLGDLTTVASRRRFEQHVRDTQALYASEAKVIVHDEHPDYFSTRWARASHTACRAVQHHHAHVVAGMVEHEWLDQQVLGIAFDGTGWGAGDTILGGEILLATAGEYERVGSLRPLPLFGGERAIQEPFRVAHALLREALATNLDEALALCGLGDWARSFDAALLNRRQFSPLTTSVGRLFDGVAAIAWGGCRASYEGEMAMRWEATCDADEGGAYPFIVAGRPLEIDWRPMVQALVADLKQGVTRGLMSMRFHRGLALAVDSIAERFPCHPIVLAGGVFQNRVLVDLLDSLFRARRRRFGWCAKIPPNDGGLAIGQLAVAHAQETGTKSDPWQRHGKEVVCV